MYHFLFTILFLAPTLSVEWVQPDKDAFSMHAPIDAPFAQQCVNGGLEFEQRFLMELCRKRSMWFDACSPIRKHIQKMSRDLLTREYRVVIDSLGDEEAPASESFQSFPLALERATSVLDLPVEFLQSKSVPTLSKRTYLSVRAFSRCNGAHSETLRQVSTVLTLGLFSLEGSDTGWIDFFFGLHTPTAPAMQR